MLVCLRMGFFKLHIHINSLNWNLCDFRWRINAQNLLLSDCLFNTHAYCPPQAINHSLLINTVFYLSFDFRKGRKTNCVLFFLLSFTVFVPVSACQSQLPGHWYSFGKTEKFFSKKGRETSKDTETWGLLQQNCLFTLQPLLLSHWNVHLESYCKSELLNVDNDHCPTFMLK